MTVSRLAGRHPFCSSTSTLDWLSPGRSIRAKLIESLALRNAEQGVAEYLFKQAKERGAPVDGGCIVELTATRSEIAIRIGSVREVVSRMFTKLQTSGLIQLIGRRLVLIPDMQTLSRFAGLQISDKPHPASDLSSEMV